MGILCRCGKEWMGDLVLAGRRPVDGMLVDMDMPIMDGRTMLRELRWLGYQIPVLMMSNELDGQVIGNC